MLWRKFTMLLSKENETIAELIWDILYKKGTCIYALPKDHHNLFNIYITNGIKSIDLGPPAVMDLEASNYMKECSNFVYNPREKYYQNHDLLEIHEPLLLNNNTIKVIRWENGQELIEYWYPIAIKYNYNSTHYCDIIVNINKL